MGHIVSQSVTITTPSSTNGTSTGYTSPMNGLVYGIRFAPSTSPITGAANVKVQTETGGFVAISSAATATTSAWRYLVRIPTHTTTGGASTGTATGDPVAVDDERLKINVWGSTAANLTGTFHVYLDGMEYTT